jgi:hypothetical protein
MKVWAIISLLSIIILGVFCLTLSEKIMRCRAIIGQDVVAQSNFSGTGQCGVPKK